MSTQFEGVDYEFLGYFGVKLQQIHEKSNLKIRSSEVPVAIQTLKTQNIYI